MIFPQTIASVQAEQALAHYLQARLGIPDARRLAQDISQALQEAFRLGSGLPVAQYPRMTAEAWGHVLATLAGPGKVWG